MKIKKICILGGGTAGWMKAAGLSNKFNTLGIEIRLVEPDQMGTVGVGEATLPHIRFFNNTLGIDEREFMQETCATFKLGIEFCDWGRQGDSYIDPFGDYGDPISGISYCADRGIQRTEGKAVETTRVPLQQRTGNGYVYCNEYISDNKAAHQLTSTLKGPALTEIKHLNF